MSDEVISTSEIAAGFHEAEAAAEKSAPATTGTGTTSTPSDVRASNGPATTTHNTAPQPATDWRAAPLSPEQSVAWGGAKTMGDIQQRYAASSQEAKRLAQEIKQLRQAAPPAPPQLAAVAPTDFFGFPDVDQYNAAMAKDPRSTVAKLIASAVRENADVIRGIVDPIFTERLAPYSQREFATTDNGLASQAFAAHPEFAPGSPGHDAGNAWVESNPAVAQTLWTAYQADPSFNFHEIVGKLANYELLKSQVANATAAKTSAGRRAASARSGSAARSAPRTDDPETNIAGIISDEQARGNDIPSTWAAGLARAFKDIR